ncbi:MAG: hypothetical protein VKJ06_07865 [Vampirovibrionales bacterium]|nr:hypothetical protein [Vampirovibrionales bacterium]
MSDTPTVDKTLEKPAAPAAAATPAAPPAPPPFNTDKMENCTARFNRYGWNVYLSVKGNQQTYETTPIRARVMTTSAASAQRLAHSLQSANTQPLQGQLTIIDDWFEASTTFLALEAIVKDPDITQILVAKL